MDEFDDVPVTLSGSGAPDPKELGSCRIEARLAAGQDGRIYRGVDLSLGRTVVVKVLHTREDQDDPGATGRFLAAGEALKGVVVPNIVQVLRTGVDDDWAYIVYEFVDGEDLDRAVR